MKCFRNRFHDAPQSSIAIWTSLTRKQLEPSRWRVFAHSTIAADKRLQRANARPNEDFDARIKQKLLEFADSLSFSKAHEMTSRQNNSNEIEKIFSSDNELHSRSWSGNEGNKASSIIAMLVSLHYLRRRKKKIAESRSTKCNKNA